MPAKNDNITKDPGAAARVKKGRKHKLTILKETIGIDKTNAILAQLEHNVEEAVTHKDFRTRNLATRAFLEYYKPKRSTSEINLKTKVTVVFENIKEVPD